jgi:hypothetical protein
MTTPEAIGEFIRRSIEFVRSHAVEIQQELNNQRTIESEIIQTTESFCPLAQLEDRTIRAEDIQRALKEGFGDANVLRSIMCLNNSTVAFPQSAGIEHNFKIRQYLENLKQIGGESADGYAMLADVKTGPNIPVSDGNNLFVVKAPRRIDANLRANQIHEYFVGAFGTNTLRSDIPNFSYIMGFFQCSPPYIDSHSYVANQPATQQNLKDRRALTFCQNDITDNQVNYLLYENVTNSVTLREFIINGCTYEQYIDILSQIVLATDKAYRSFGFTHYDLHDENVLVRELPDEISIPYEVDDKGTVNYLHTKYVATIIDYGRSHIEYQGKHFGYALIEYGLYPTRPYPMYDIYKVLMFSLASAAFGQQNMQTFAGLSDDQLAQQGRFANADVFQNAKELISYFDPALVRNNTTHHLITSADYLIKTRQFYYSLPYSPQFDIRPIRFFQDAMVTAFPSTISKFLQSQPPNSTQLYGCANKGTCHNLQQAIMEYSKPDINYIDDAYIFYEMIMEARGSTSGQTSLQQLMSDGESRYSRYIEQLRTDRNKFSNEYNQLIQGYTVVSLTLGAPDDYKFQDTYLDLYRRFIAKSVNLVDILTSIAQIELVVRTLNEFYPRQAEQIVPGLNYRYLDIPQMEFDPIRQSVGGLNEVITSIKRDVIYIQGLSPEQILRIYPNAIWLFQKMPSLVAAISQL